jgi:hypothetical protein
MALNIKHAKSVLIALRRHLARLRRPRPSPPGVVEILTDTQERLARLPVLDARTPNEILGYDESGLPR